MNDFDTRDRDGREGTDEGGVELVLSVTLEAALADLFGASAGAADELVNALGCDEETCEAFRNCEVQTFADAMLMTRDHGLILTLADGSEFQLTIVRSK